MDVRGTAGTIRACPSNNRESNVRALNIITLLLVIVGGLNWGLVAIFNFDLVTAILGQEAGNSQSATIASRAVYLLVALSALWQLVPLSRSFSDDRVAVSGRY